MICPLIKSRKLRWRSARKVCGMPPDCPPAGNSAKSSGAVPSPSGVSGAAMLYFRIMRATMNLQSGGESLGRRKSVSRGVSGKRHLRNQQTKTEKDQDAPVAVAQPAPRLAQILSDFSTDAAISVHGAEEPLQRGFLQ